LAPGMEEKLFFFKEKKEVTQLIPHKFISLLTNLSEIVFSKSIKAPPQMKRMSFVSICEDTITANIIKN
jgi:hypothetical protein